MLACIKQVQFDRILATFQSRMETATNLSVHVRDNSLQTSCYRNHSVSYADYLTQSQYHVYFIALLKKSSFFLRQIIEQNILLNYVSLIYLFIKVH